MAPTLFSLPLPVLSHIFEFAVDGFATEVVVPRAPFLSPYHLQRVAFVSKHSLQTMKVLAEQFRASSLTLGSEGSMTAEDIPPMYQLAESKGPAVRSLTVSLGRKESGYDPKPGALDDSDIDWDRIFGHLFNLKRLDLSELSLVSRHVPEILEAASKHCYCLEALVLPSRGFVSEDHYEYTNAVYGAPIEKLMTALYQSLEKWHDKKAGRGLRQLTAPTRNEVERLRSTTELIEAVMKFCPQIEYLDGYKKVTVHGDAQCYDMWAITVDTWEKFNKTCKNLKTFSWAVVPFADPFFQVFGDYLKPMLTELSLSANECWNYHRYFRECDGHIVAPPPNDDEEGVEASRPGYGLLALEIAAVLRACPALTKLSIAIDYRRNGRSRYVNTSLYGDEFWEAVADRCPQLETITMSDCSGYTNYNVKSVDTLTDRTLLSLARMKSLRSLELARAFSSIFGASQETKRLSRRTLLFRSE